MLFSFRALLVLIVFVHGSIAWCNNQGKNVVENGEFEGTRLCPWELTQGRWSINGDDWYNGLQSLQLSPALFESTGNLQQTFDDLQANTRYEFSAWVRLGDSARLIAAGLAVGDQNTSAHASSDWQWVRVEFTTPRSNNHQNNNDHHSRHNRKITQTVSLFVQCTPEDCSSSDSASSSDNSDTSSSESSSYDSSEGSDYSSSESPYTRRFSRRHSTGNDCWARFDSISLVNCEDRSTVHTTASATTGGYDVTSTATTTGGEATAVGGTTAVTGGVGGSSGVGGGGTSGNITVYLNSLFFTPEFLEITVGDTVNFVWVRDLHTVTAVDGSFDSGLHAAPFVYSVSFTEPGDAFYYSKVQASIGMMGLIRVRAA